MILCTLQDPNMKMCTLVGYPSPLRFTPVILFWTIYHALCHHNSSHMLNEMYMKLSILQDPNMKMCTIVPYLVHWGFLELYPKLCTCTSLDSNVKLCAFKHRNSPFELFFTKYGFDIGLMDLHKIVLFSRSYVKGQDHMVTYLSGGICYALRCPCLYIFLMFLI
jgi:hypothetical protein